MPFEPFELDDEVERALGRFMRSMGFFSGSTDLVIDTEGAAWFIECNNQGAWAWLDNIVGGAVTRLFADKISARALQGPGGEDRAAGRQGPERVASPCASAQASA